MISAVGSTPLHELAGAGSASRRAAVIDLGSNSWRLIVFDYTPGGCWRRVDGLKETVRVAAGLAATGRMRTRAIELGVRTFDVFARYCEAGGIAPADIEAVATSAIRDAANGEELLARAQAATGLPIRVLPAAEEAHYGYLAAVNSTTLTDGAVVDLGGGSLQLVEVLDRRPRAHGSWPLGAVRATEQLLPGPGPHPRKALKRARSAIRAELAGASWLDPTERVVALGGAVRNLAAAAQRVQGLPDTGIQGFLLTAGALEQLIATLAALPAAERGDVPGIKPGRGDIILAAALVLQAVMERSSAPGLEVTGAGLREGVLFATRLFAGSEPLVADVRRASVRNLAVQHDADLAHVEHVAELATQLHESLAAGGAAPVGGEERELLWAAAMLHRVGHAIDYEDHQKHSRYLILSAGLPGFSPRELALIAQIARYQLKGTPGLDDLAVLARSSDRGLVRRCAVVLRLARQLERGQDQSVREARFTPGEGGMVLKLRARGDATLARWSVARYGGDEDFRRAFGHELDVA